MEIFLANQVEANFDGMGWKWNGKNSSDKVCIGNGNGVDKKNELSGWNFWYNGYSIGKTKWNQCGMVMDKIWKN